MDVGIITFETNVETPHNGPSIEVPPLSENLADTVELSQQDELVIPEDVDTTLAFFSHASSRRANSSRSMPPAVALVPLARVQKLEEQMATLLHYIQLWMQKPIAEAEEHIEKGVVKQVEQ